MTIFPVYYVHSHFTTLEMGFIIIDLKHIYLLENAIRVICIGGTMGVNMISMQNTLTM